MNVLKLINSAYELIDTENRVMVNVFRVDGEVVAKYTYDFSDPENDKIEGSLPEYFLSQGIEWEEGKQKEFHKIKREEAKYYLDVFSK